jgi:hypothetical protein
VVQPNGIDFWWDDQGRGNCWEDNVSATGRVSWASVLPPPSCAVGSLSPAGDATKSAGLLLCSGYNRDSKPDPAGCDWMRAPEPPDGRHEAPGDALAAFGPSEIGTGATDEVLPATGDVPHVFLLGALVALFALAARSRRRATRGRP